jgi:hypothetical protein
MKKCLTSLHVSSVILLQSPHPPFGIEQPLRETRCGKHSAWSRAVVCSICTMLCMTRPLPLAPVLDRPSSATSSQRWATLIRAMLAINRVAADFDPFTKALGGQSSSYHQAIAVDVFRESILQQGCFKDREYLLLYGRQCEAIDLRDFLP